jgi:hypothetical protein
MDVMSNSYGCLQRGESLIEKLDTSAGWSAAMPDEGSRTRIEPSS